MYRFPSLQRVECKANEESKYWHRVFGGRRRTLEACFALPAIDGLLDDAMNAKVAAVVLAVLNGAISRRSIGILGLTPDVLATLSSAESLGLPPMDTEFLELTHLDFTICTPARLPFDDETMGEYCRLALQVVNRLLANSPNLESFTFDPGDFEMSLSFVNTHPSEQPPAPTFSKLQKMYLANVLYSQKDFIQMLRTCSRTITEVSIEAAELYDGHWVDVFAYMRSLTRLEVCNFDIELWEEEGFWDFPTSDELEEEIKASHLREQTRLWILRKVEDALFFMGDCPDAEKQWVEVADATMRWKNWDDVSDDEGGDAGDENEDNGNTEEA